jgi:hypothetical protein
MDTTSSKVLESIMKRMYEHAIGGTGCGGTDAYLLRWSDCIHHRPANAEEERLKRSGR